MVILSIPVAVVIVAVWIITNYDYFGVNTSFYLDPTLLSIMNFSTFFWMVLGYSIVIKRINHYQSLVV